MIQLSVIDLFYLEDSRKIHLWGVRARRSKDMRRRAPQGAGEREREWERQRERKSARTRERKSEKALCSSFYMFFSSTWACPMQIGLSQEYCLFYLKSSLWSSDLPVTFLCSIFGGFSLPCLLATAILDSFSLLYLPNNPIRKFHQLLFPVNGAYAWLPSLNFSKQHSIFFPKGWVNLTVKSFR